jgi:Domain of unknown function (DU1801)
MIAIWIATSEEAEMEPTKDNVDEFLNGIEHEKRRRDAKTLLNLIETATGENPRMWGSIVGFGQYDYRYESGREGTAPIVGFAPRKAATTIYLAHGLTAQEDLLRKLGPHTTGVGCLYIKNLEAVDVDVLSKIVAKSYETAAMH